MMGQNNNFIITRTRRRRRHKIILLFILRVQCYYINIFFFSKSKPLQPPAITPTHTLLKLSNKADNKIQQSDELDQQIHTHCQHLRAIVYGLWPAFSDNN